MIHFGFRHLIKEMPAGDKENERDVCQPPRPGKETGVHHLGSTAAGEDRRT